MAYDIISGMKFAFEGLHDKEVMQWMLLFALAAIAAAFVSGATTVLIPALIAADWILLGIPLTTIAAVVFSVLLGVAYVLVWLFFQYQFYRAGLRLAGYKPPANSPTCAQFVFVTIKMALVSLFSWYDKRVLAIVLLLYAITALWAAAGFFTNNGILLMVGAGFLAFTVLVHYLGVFLHGIRALFAPLFYLKDGSYGGKAPSRSFALVKNRTFDVAIPLIGGLFIFWLAYIPAVILWVCLVGFALEAAIFAMSMLYVAHVFAHYEHLGPVEKKKQEKE